MNSATLKTLREACGLSVADLASVIKSPRTGGFIKERTVHYWEKGKNAVPDDVATFIQKLDKTLTLSANDFIPSPAHENVRLIRFKTNEDFWGAFPSLINLPVTCHAAILNRIRLRLEPTNVFIEWYEN